MLDYLIEGGTADRRHRRARAPRRRRRPRRPHRRGRRRSTSRAHETIDADGLVVAPGFVDPHTHYDAQLFWDPLASPSNLHGVTTVVGGNCGFTLAPLAPEDADYLRRMMAKVEGMPLAALENGVPWNWSIVRRLPRSARRQRRRSTPAFLVGHCALRRNVMGADAIGNEATPEQIERWCSCCTSRSTRAASASRPRSRSRTPTATASPSRRAGRRRTRCWRCARPCATTRAPRSSTSPTAACAASATTRST